MKRILFIALTIGLVACGGEQKADENHGEHGGWDSSSGATKMVETTHYENESHLQNVRQLTYGGDNAEAYWSFDNKNLVFQATNPKWGVGCDQIYVMPVEGKKDSLRHF